MSLGLIIDDNLSWNSHITKISKTISAGINALKRMRPFIGITTAIKIYIGLIEPHFNYCSSVWDEISCKLNEKLQKLQNRAARVKFCTRKTHWESYEQHVRIIKLF